MPWNNQIESARSPGMKVKLQKVSKLVRLPLKRKEQFMMVVDLFGVVINRIKKIKLRLKNINNIIVKSLNEHNNTECISIATGSKLIKALEQIRKNKGEIQCAQ